MGCELVKTYLQLFHTAGCIVLFQDTIGNRLFSRLFFGRHLSHLSGKHFLCIRGIRDDLGSVQHISASII